MAAKRKRRRRKATTRRYTRRRRVLANPRPAARRRSSRRRYRRNPPVSIKGILNRVVDAAVGGATVVAGEAGTRLVRSRVLGMPAGETLSSVAELGIATGLGVVAEMVGLPRQLARDLVVGGYAGVFRATAKQLGIPLVSEALGNDGGGVGGRYLVRGGRVTRQPLSGYVRRPLAGYVGAGAPGTTVLGDVENEELGYG